METYGNFSLKAGTVSGTVLSVAGSMGFDETMRTIVLAAIGATVSFFVSLALKKVVEWWRDD